MTNTRTAKPTARPAAAKRPTPATQRAALVKAGTHTKDEAAALAPKALLAAFAALASTPAPAPAPRKPRAAKPEAIPAPAPAAPAAPANFPLCGCGCGVPTVTAKAKFLSGHDARFAGRVGRGEVEPTEAQQALLDASPRLAAKVDGIRATAAKRAAAKAAREAAKRAADAAYAEALAAALA